MKNLCKAITVMMIVTLTMGSINIVFAAFTDVSASHSNYDAIKYVEGEGIVEGYDDGTFRPDITINRAEFTKIIIGARFSVSEIDGCIAKETEPTNEAVFFPDVPKSAWFAKYICVAKVNNVVKGYDDGTFKPGNMINFAEASKIIANAFGAQTATGEPWYKPFVTALGQSKAIPTSITSFDTNITRGEMAEMIYRLRAGITDKPSLTYDQLATLSTPGIVMSITYESNGDEISGWNWLRDSSLNHYALYTITGVPTDKKSIQLDWEMLATNSYSGGPGYDATFRVYYGSTSATSYGYEDVTLPNVSPENDPVGYTCKGSVLIPSAASSGNVLYVRVKRISSSDHHVAFRNDSIRELTASDSESTGVLGGDDTTGDLADDTGDTTGDTMGGTTGDATDFEYSDADTDNDDMPDTVEDLYGTNKNLADTDGDGVNDSEDLSPRINPSEPTFNDIQKIGMVRIEQPIMAYGLDGWAEKWHKNALCDLKFDASYEDSGTKKSSMDASHYKLALNKVFEEDKFTAYKVLPATATEIGTGDTERTHDKIAEDSLTFDSTCIVTPNEYRFFYDYITDFQMAYLKNTTERKYPDDTNFFRYMLYPVKMKSYKEQFFTFQFTDAAMYNAMYDTDSTHYKMPGFMYSFYSSNSFNTDATVPYYEAFAMATPEAVNRFSATLHIPKEKNTHSAGYVKITPMWVIKNGFPVTYEPLVPSMSVTGLTRDSVLSRDDRGNSRVIKEEFNSFDGLNLTAKDATYFTGKTTSSDYTTQSGWMGVITKDTTNPENAATPYTVLDVTNKVQKYVEKGGAQVSNAVTLTENMVQAMNKVDKIENLPSTHWARSAKYNSALAGLGTATGIISIATNGNEAWKAIQDGNTADVVYYSAKTVAGAASTASSLAQISQRTVGYAGKAGRFAKLTSDKFAVGLAVAIGAVEVSYDIYKLSQANDPIEQAAYTEKIGADIIDTELSVGAVFSPHILVFQVTWTVEAEIYSWIFGEDFAYTVAQSPGKALVFLGQYFFTETIPSVMAEEAYLNIRGDCPNDNILDCTGIIGLIRRENDVQLPYLAIFIDPDV